MVASFVSLGFRVLNVDMDVWALPAAVKNGLDMGREIVEQFKAAQAKELPN
jgi:hypothetical protein